MESSSSYGSSKRAKAASNINQIVHCLVDGCNADLSLYREYHRRHKVCEIHSKTSKVMIGGHEQRFCQQCSRFHSLTEFDEGKRSCRKRLEGHNRRRRKPQRDSLSGNSGMFLCSQEGTRLVSFGSQQMLPSASASSAWAGSVKTENELLIYSSPQHSDYADRQSSFLGCSAHSYQVNQFQFLQGTDQSHAEATVCQPVLDRMTLSDELNPVFDSDGALSLLSSAPAVTVSSGGIGSNQMVQPAPNHPSSQFSMHYSGLAQHSFNQEMDSKPVVSLTDANCRDNANANARHNHRVFRDNPDPDGSSSGKSHQTITFRWK